MRYSRIRYSVGERSRERPRRLTVDFTYPAGAEAFRAAEEAARAA